MLILFFFPSFVSVVEEWELTQEEAEARLSTKGKPSTALSSGEESRWTDEEAKKWKDLRIITMSDDITKCKRFPKKPVNSYA